jgi:hypothetical protein
MALHTWHRLFNLLRLQKGPPEEMIKGKWKRDSLQIGAGTVRVIGMRSSTARKDVAMMGLELIRGEEV